MPGFIKTDLTSPSRCTKSSSPLPMAALWGTGSEGTGRVSFPASGKRYREAKPANSSHRAPSELAVD